MIFCISVQIQIHIPNAIFVHCAGGGLLLLGRQMQFDPDGRLFFGRPNRYLYRFGAGCEHRKHAREPNQQFFHRDSG